MRCARLHRDDAIQIYSAFSEIKNGRPGGVAAGHDDEYRRVSRRPEPQNASFLEALSLATPCCEPPEFGQWKDFHNPETTPAPTAHPLARSNHFHLRNSHIRPLLSRYWTDPTTPLTKPPGTCRQRDAFDSLVERKTACTTIQTNKTHLFSPPPSVTTAAASLRTSVAFLLSRFMQRRRTEPNTGHRVNMLHVGPHPTADYRLREFPQRFVTCGLQSDWYN